MSAQIETLGTVIRNARKKIPLTQRQLSRSIGINFTYLSKIENDRSNYPPTESVIKGIARELDLNEEELIFLSGRIPEKYLGIIQANFSLMPKLFQLLRDNPSRLLRAIALFCEELNN